MTEPQPTPKLKNNNKSYEISGWEDENLALKPKLIRGIYSMGFEIPSSIQKKSIVSNDT